MPLRKLPREFNSEPRGGSGDQATPAGLARGRISALTILPGFVGGSPWEESRHSPAALDLAPDGVWCREACVVKAMKNWLLALLVLRASMEDAADMRLVLTRP